jgi:predicted transcriptional regulator
MKTYEKSLNRQGELKAIAILMLRHMEINLAPIDRIIFLRLLICYGGRRISLADLKTLAKEVKVNWLTLKKSLKALVEKGLCEQVDEKSFKLNKGLLPRQVGYRWRWTPSDRLIVTLEKAKEGDQSTAELKENKSAKKSHKIIGGKKTASELVARYPRYDFLEILFGLIFDVKISHKQKNADQLLELNYKQWLVLVNMVLSSDSNGVVLNVGTYELSNWTGMSRNALQRAIAELLSMGILRTKLDGTLNNVYLSFVSAIYFLNLSHAIWGEKRIFGRYLIFNRPQQTTILKQLLESVDRWDPNEPLSKFKTTEFILNRNKTSDSVENAYILESNEYSIPNILQTGEIFNTKFHQEFQLSRSHASEQKELLLNTEELNFKRLEYMFCYLASHCPNITLTIHQLQGHLVPENVKLMMVKSFKEVRVVEQIERKANTLLIKLSDIMMAQNHLKQQILSLLIQYVYRSELSHILDVLAEITDRKHDNKVVPLGCVGKSMSHKIYFSSDSHLKHDELFCIQYTEAKITDPKIYESAVIKAYKRSIKQIDYDLKKQIELGLLNEKCLGDKFE